jgi:hypothetical protein
LRAYVLITATIRVLLEAWELACWMEDREGMIGNGLMNKFDFKKAEEDREL